MSVSKNKTVIGTTETKNLDASNAPSEAVRAMHVPTAEDAAQAYQRCAADIEALDAELIGRITTDVPRAVSVALSALADIEALLPLMREVIVKPPVERIARLRERALALWHAHRQYAPKVTGQLDADLEEAAVLRDLLLTAAENHAAFGKMDRGAIAEIRDGAGHLDRAGDLADLSELFTSSWSSIEKTTEVTLAQVKRAGVLGARLMTELGDRFRGKGQAVYSREWSDRRNRAYSLFMEDYDYVRFCVGFTRYWERDADDFAPSLFTRSSPRPQPELEEGTGATGPAPAAPATSTTNSS